MKTPSNIILFTDETRASLDGPDCWKKGWILDGQPKLKILVRQRQRGGIMIWAGIYDDKILGPYRVQDDLKLISKT